MSPNPWSQEAERRSLLIRPSALMGIGVVVSGLTACRLSESEPAPAQPSTPNADVRVAVSFQSNASDTRLDSRFAGLSYEKSKLAVPMFTASNASLIRMFSLLGPSVLRIGANAVDRSSWNGEVDGLTPILPSQIDALAAFVAATQWKVIYGVNLARNTPENAADEAAYVASRLGPYLLAWEIGNEPDLYRRHGYRPDDWGYDEFLDEWHDYRAAMSEASPNVPFSGPGTTFELERNTLRFAEDAAEQLAILSHHYYRADADDPRSDLTLLLEPDPALATELTRLVAAASNAAVPIGVRLTEANSFFGGGLPGVSNAYGSGLWVMDFMFQCALAGCTGVNIHGGSRGPYTPIADVDGTVVEPRAIFYGMVMFANAAHGLPLEGVVAADADISLSAWGVQREDGGLNAVLINKDDESTVGVRLTTGISAERFEPLWLEGSGLSATDGFTLGDAPIGNDGNWSPQPRPPLAGSDGVLDVVLPPATAVLLRSL